MIADVAAVLAQITSDPSLYERFQDDPAGVLAELGLTPEQIQDVLEGKYNDELGKVVCVNAVCKKPLEKLS